MIILIKTYEFAYDRGRLIGIKPTHEVWLILAELVPV